MRRCRQKGLVSSGTDRGVVRCMAFTVIPVVTHRVLGQGVERIIFVLGFQLLLHVLLHLDLYRMASTEERMI